MNWNHKGYVYLCDTNTGEWSALVEGQKLTSTNHADLCKMIEKEIERFPKMHQGLHIHRFNRDHGNCKQGEWVATFPDATSWLDYLLKAKSQIELMAQIELYRTENPLSKNPWQLPRTERIARMSA